jgi:hypothetical protein
LAIKADTANLLAVEVSAEPAERLRVLVNHRQIVAETFQGQGQRSTHPATTHDHDMHAVTPGSVGAKKVLAENRIADATAILSRAATRP